MLLVFAAVSRRYNFPNFVRLQSRRIGIIAMLEIKVGMRLRLKAEDMPLLLRLGVKVRVR